MIGSIGYGRRHFLQASGVLLALPQLSDSPARAASMLESGNATGMLLISNNLGVLPDQFFPDQGGEDYELSPYLQHLSEQRDQFTVFSGLSHPDVDGGHSTENCFLTGARGPTKSGFRNTVSLDQFVAESMGPITRFPSLNLGVNVDRAHRSLSWTRNGILLPVEDSPARMFMKLFLQGTAEQTAAEIERLRQQRSILDVLLQETQKLQRGLGRQDRDRMDQYLTAIRELELRMSELQEWERRPRPTTNHEPPVDITEPARVFDRMQLMLEMALLALQTDSTRIVTLMVDAFATPRFLLQDASQTSDGYHNLSHHGQDEVKLQQLRDADHRQMKMLACILEKMQTVRSGEQTLLDRTMVLFGSNMGDSNTHVNTNLPVLLAGGGLRHGSHLMFSSDRNRPLCDLYVTMLQRMGLGVDQFSSSVGSLNELLPGR